MRENAKQDLGIDLVAEGRSAAMRLSVCITAYNHEQFIEQAIASAVNQDVPFDYDIVVGEDCSRDATAEVLRTIEKRNNGRVKVYYREENIGAAENFARTVEACSGEYIAFLDGDDYWTSKSKLALQVAFLDQHPEAVFCFHRSRSLDEAGHNSEFVLPPSEPAALSSFDYLLQENPIALSSVVARRSSLGNLAREVVNLKLGDWPIYLLLSRQGRIGYIPRDMSRYRVHPGGSWSNLNRHLRVAYVIQMLERISRFFSSEERVALQRRKADIAAWWAGDLLCDPSVPLEALLNDLSVSNDSELLVYLLSNVLTVGRRIREAQLYWEKQAQPKPKARRRTFWQRITRRRLG